MSAIEFEQWWKEFMRYHIRDNDNGRSMLNEFKNLVLRFERLLIRAERLVMRVN
jgi:N-glycosylase/DNA lyase